MSNLVNPNWPTGLDTAKQVDDKRNIIDYYKYWEDAAIREDLDTKRTPLSLLLENYAHDFNISTTIRNANAFTVGEVWLSGRKKFDRRGAVGTYLYENIFHAPTSEKVINNHKDKGYKIVVADNIEGAISLDNYVWDPNTLLVFGQESIGVSQTAIDMADDVIYIPQRGSVRSLNVGSASGIFMYHYTAQISPVE